MSDTSFQPLPKHIKTNFETLITAGLNGDLAIMSAKDSKTGEPVTLICAVNKPTEDDPEYQFVPLAMMIDGDPYTMFTPCTQESE